MSIKLILLLYLAVINLISLAQFWIDKKKADKQKMRISEKTLFLTAILGGALGAWIGMYAFRHKTKHWYFVVLIPLILLLWVAVFYFFVL